jgi:lysophospholipase L1-like esterase
MGLNLRLNFLRILRVIKGKNEDHRNNLKASPLNKLKWNALGDSITNGELGETNYRTIIAKEEGMLVRNYGLHGCRITRDVANPSSLDTEMSTRYKRMDDDADIITVFGGINDINGKLPIGEMEDRENTTFYGALHFLLVGLQKKYIGKRIGFITPLNYGDAKSLPYINAIKEVCGYYSIPVLDLYTNGLIVTHIKEVRNALCPDGLHPNTEGHKVLARKIKQFILTL